MTDAANTLSVTLSGVSKAFTRGSRRREVLNSIDLQIQQGEFVSLIGPSGSGKTTLLNIIGMLDNEFIGEYHFNGKAVQQLSHKQRQALSRKHIGFVFQQYHLLAEMTVAENIELILTYRNESPRQRRQTVADVLHRFDIADRADDYPSELSGGQQQLVAVARSVAARPDIILADEPTGALHSSQGEMIMRCLAELNAEGTTIVQVTHNPKTITYSQRNLEILDGRLC